MDNTAPVFEENHLPTILVIEDDDAIRELIVTLLIAEDYDVMEAENGELGLSQAIADAPDLILCDITLPGISGYQILDALQADPLTDTIPFIYLSARGTKENIRQGMNIGADDYLTKPFTTQELLDSIAARLRKHRLWRTHFRQKQQTDQQQINYTLTHDPITQLPNQLALRDDLNHLLKKWQETHAVTDPEEEKKWMIPIFYLRMDRFERINELFGYQFGNTVIKGVVRYLIGLISESAYLACLNYTDFVLIYPPIKDVSPENLRDIIDPILTAFNSPITVETERILINWHIGSSTMPYLEFNFDKYLNQAKEAMKTVRTQGNQNYFFYQSHPSPDPNHQTRLLDADLYEALHHDQFVLYYQPKIDLSTGKMVSAEVLVRWQHPTMGMVSPGLFIPLAEQNGLISGIGQWVFEESCRQLQQWQDQGITDFRLAVNLSGRQFYQPQLAKNLVAIMDGYDISVNQLELEVTESILISDVDLAIANLQSLKERGFPIAIDDFGTGYSSLSYLQNFPFDILKIDRCFVHNIMRNVTNATIVKHIIMLSQQLNLTTVAEGVENIAELEFLKAQNCNEIQGYLFSHPVDLESFNKILEEDCNFLEKISLHTQ